MPNFSNPHDALRHHVSGAIERGEAEPITAREESAEDIGNRLFREWCERTVLGEETGMEYPENA